MLRIHITNYTTTQTSETTQIQPQDVFQFGNTCNFPKLAQKFSFTPYVFWFTKQGDNKKERRHCGRLQRNVFASKKMIV